MVSAVLCVCCIGGGSDSDTTNDDEAGDRVNLLSSPLFPSPSRSLPSPSLGTGQVRSSAQVWDRAGDADRFASLVSWSHHLVSALRRFDADLLASPARSPSRSTSSTRLLTTLLVLARSPIAHARSPRSLAGSTTASKSPPSSPPHSSASPLPPSSPSKKVTPSPSPNPNPSKSA